MKCKDCNLCWADPGEDFPTCKADPNWPAPCEYEDEPVVDDGYDPGLEPDWEMFEEEEENVERV